MIRTAFSRRMGCQEHFFNVSVPEGFPPLVDRPRAVHQHIPVRESGPDAASDFRFALFRRVGRDDLCFQLVDTGRFLTLVAAWLTVRQSSVHRKIRPHSNRSQ
jgi:hypothetical protein